MARLRWPAAVADAAVAADVVVEAVVHVAAVVFRAAAVAFRTAAGTIPGATTAAVKAFHEETLAVVVTPAAVGVRETDSEAVLAGVEVTFHAPPAEAIFPRPTFREVTSQAPRVHRDPAAGVSHREARSVLRPALVRPAAERPSCPQGIDQVKEGQRAPRKNPPVEPNLPAELRKPDQAASRRSFRRKAPVIFSGRRSEPVLAPR